MNILSLILAKINTIFLIIKYYHKINYKFNFVLVFDLKFIYICRYIKQIYNNNLFLGLKVFEKEIVSLYCRCETKTDFLSDVTEKFNKDVQFDVLKIEN